MHRALLYLWFDEQMDYLFSKMDKFQTSTQVFSLEQSKKHAALVKTRGKVNAIHHALSHLTDINLFSIQPSRVETIFIWLLKMRKIELSIAQL